MTFGLLDSSTFAASIAQADMAIAACRQNGVFLNLGTNRRYDVGFDAAYEKIWSGDIGKLKTIIVHSTSSLFNGASHSLDAVNRLNGDAKPVWCTCHLEDGDQTIEQLDGSIVPVIDVNGFVLRAATELCCRSGAMLFFRRKTLVASMNAVSKTKKMP